MYSHVVGQRVGVHRAVVDARPAPLPCRTRPACASSSCRRRGRGNPRGHGRRGFRCGCGAESTVTTAWAIRLSNSSVSTRSVFQIRPRSVTRMSSAPRQTSRDARRRPPPAPRRCGRRRSSSCIAFCIASAQLGGRRAAVGVAEAVEAGERRRSSAAFGRSRWFSPASIVSAQRRPAARPNTTRSISELEPRRLAPCTETQAASPTAIRPGHDACPDRRPPWSAPRRDSSWGCRPCCSARSAAPGSARW